MASADASVQTSSTLYRVKEGDTLSAIARLFEVSVSSITSWNSLRDNNIQVGQRLRVHSPVASATR